MKLSEYMRYRNYSRRQLMEEGTFRIDIDPATLKLGYPFGVYLFVVTLEQRDIFNSDGKLVQVWAESLDTKHVTIDGP
jgi:hypothetical protein